MILSEAEKKAIIEVLSSHLKGKSQIYLYGSRARNIDNKESDIDLLILSEQPISNEEVRIMKILISEKLSGTKIDIVVSDFTKKSPFVKLIEENAILLWERR
jgi:predicted nucleotidyltransferase